MTVREFVEELNLEVVAGPALDKEIEGAYSGDIPHDVMERAETNDIWLTVRNDLVAVGVALLANISAVVVVEGLNYEEIAVKKACENDVNLLKYSGSKFELSAKFIKKYYMDKNKE